MIEAGKLRVGLGQGAGAHRGVSADDIRRNGATIRALIGAAAAEGARLVAFTEGALSYPTKRAISADPDQVTVADWSKYAWDAVEEELRTIGEAAAEHSVWVVVGCLTRSPDPGRPYNSLVVFDDHGTTIGRYDKRHLSRNEDAVYRLTRGSEPLIFTVDGIRVGCLLCIEGMLPELVIEYEQLEADALILATMTEGPSPANEDKRVLALAEMADLWVLQPTPALQPDWLGSSVAWPGYRWLVRGTPGEQPSVVIAGLDLTVDDWRVRAGRESGRPWRQRQRLLLDGR
ncbi:carbon-nitrogen hydrolase family protein [Microlunatus parietis]|uniref:Putative amidohydrolase n=1 Tax=Microlunatus parietis TaxID=682979 RepID=A0A7Y9IAF6_9ACTN|nr:carbon-nitrogen hydrolase family protein [Microlunatus parietis]NYE73197.1 putative amidohydrolase [Microlunatus parietis]